MGQCVSSRSGKGEIARKKGVPPTKYPFKGPHFKMEGRGKHSNLPSKGAAMSFGFKPQVSSTQTNFNKTPITTEKKETAIDINVNNQTTARSGTPRLARPKKDTNGNCGARTNRFGFRSPVTPLSNKVADSQTNEAPSLYINYTENNSVTELKSSLKLSSSKSNASDSSHSTCSTGSDENNKQSKTNVQGIPKLQSATRFTLHTSHLPRPQFPVRLVTPANYHSTDKNAKTAANKVQQKSSKAQSENGGSSASSVTDADSGVGSQKSGTDIETQGIEHLDESPSAKNKLRNSTSVKKSRPMEMVFTNNQKKTFELRELNDAIEVTEIVPLQLPPLPHHRTQPNGMVRERALVYQQSLRDKIPQNDQQITFSSDEDECFDESFGDEPCGEEKQHRDRMLSEKNEKGCIGAGESEAEELWGGVGEAMICDDDLANPSCADNNQEGIDSMNPPLRSVLLTIEDPAFATLAAMSSSAMIEDETSPDFSSSPPSSAAELPITQPSLDSNKKNLAGNTPESPGTPTHASNSLSLSEGRDFLIDDEIADQPGLVFDEGTSSGNFTTANSSGNTIVPEEMIDHIPEHHDNSITDGHVPSKTPRKMSHISEDCSPAHNASVGTLSSCESIASDDLMLDFDPSETNSTFGDNLDTRLEVGGLSERDEETLRMIQNDDVLREWSSRLASGLGNGVRATRLLRPRVGSSGSGGTESPRSVTLDSQRLRSSPLRTSRQGASSPGEDLSEDSGIRLDRETYQDMFQDVINIKTVLLRLKRVFQNQETENAFENSLQNGLYYNLGHDGATEEISNPKKDAEVADELADLRRQVVFLQQQLKEKDRVIQTLQESITRLKETREDKHNLEVTRETSNAATQTERIRPVSSGPSLLQGLPNDGAGGSLVSNTSKCKTNSSSIS